MIIVNNTACQISLELEQPIEIRGEAGNLITAKTVLFKKPSRSSSGLFQKLASMITRATLASIALVKDVTGNQPEQNQKKPESAIASIENISSEQITEEVDGLLTMLSALDMDFEKAQQLFDKMLLSETRFPICYIGGKPITDGMLDSLDYHDYWKMFTVYICFFGKPAKSGTKRESEMPLESAAPVTEL